MFFLLLTANLTLYLSSAQLLLSNSWIAGMTTFASGVTLTLFSKLSYDKIKRRGKLTKKICGSLDCIDCGDCGDCGSCDC